MLDSEVGEGRVGRRSLRSRSSWVQCTAPRWFSAVFDAAARGWAGRALVAGPGVRCHYWGADPGGNQGLPRVGWVTGP